MRDNETLTQAAVDMLIVFLEHEGWSSGQLSLEMETSRTNIHGWMRFFESRGFGEYTISDGMRYFWFSPDGRKRVEALRGE